MSSAISSASSGGKSLRPTSVARSGSLASAACVLQSTARPPPPRSSGAIGNQPIGGRERALKVKWKTGVRAVAAPHVENEGSDAAAHRDLGAHAVGPEAVNLALLERLRGGHAEVHAGALRPRHGSDRTSSRCTIDAGSLEQTAQPHVDPGCRADAAPLDDAGIAALSRCRSACMTRNQYMPCACAQRSFTPCHSGKADSAEWAEPPTKSIVAVAQRAVGGVDREDQLDLDVEPFAP